MHESASPNTVTDETGEGQLAYKIPHAARVLDMSVRKVWALVHSGEIESFKIGSSRRVTRKALLNYIDRQEHAA